MRINYASHETDRGARIRRRRELVLMGKIALVVLLVGAVVFLVWAVWEDSQREARRQYMMGGAEGRAPLPFDCAQGGRVTANRGCGGFPFFLSSRDTEEL